MATPSPCSVFAVPLPKTYAVTVLENGKSLFYSGPDGLTVVPDKSVLSAVSADLRTALESIDEVLARLFAP
jgi:hypothetical protein